MVIAILAGARALEPRDPRTPPPRLIGTPCDVRDDDGMQEITLSELLASLPDVDAERTWNPRRREFVLAAPAEELSRRLAAGVQLTDEQWSEALLRSGALRTRPKWPATHPYAVSMRAPSWLGVVHLRMVPLREDLRSAEVRSPDEGACGTLIAWEYRRALYQELGYLPLGEHELTFDVTLARGSLPPSASADRSNVIWSGTLSARVEVVEDLRSAVPSREDFAADEVVRSAFRLDLSDWIVDGRHERSAMAILEPRAEGLPLMSTTALSLRVEVLRRGDVVETCYLPARCCGEWPPASLESDEGRSLAPEARLRSIPSSIETATERALWSFRIEGTDEGILHLWNAETVWRGSLTLSLEEALQGLDPAADRVR